MRKATRTKINTEKNEILLGKTFKDVDCLTHKLKCSRSRGLVQKYGGECTFKEET